MGPGGGGACASAAGLTRLEPGASAHQPNQKTPNNMNHTIRKTSQHDARVAFEISHPFAASDPGEVWRIRLQQESFVSMPEGIILESNHQKGRAVVVNARSGDIVVIRHKAGDESMAPYQCYLIGDSFEPRLIENSSLPFQSVGISPPESRIETDEGRVVHYDEPDLKKLLRGKHPRWLQQFVDGQLRRWRDHTPATFVRLAPREWLDREVILVAIYDPYRALCDYRDRLTENQLEFCIRRLSGDAARLLFRQIPRKFRWKHLKEHANYILENHLHQLSDAELRRCSWGAPLTAFKIRHSVAPRRSAIVLASTYTIAWIRNHRTSRVDLRREIFDSLRQYPEEWLKSNPKGIESIFKRLENLLGICFGSAELTILLEQMIPKGRMALSQYISSHI